MRKEEHVILVDENDNEIGTMEKMEAHRKGKLHRAFSIFVFNSKGELMMQKRAKMKYHSGGLLTNTCCSHPRVGESIQKAAHRRLMEEMGFDCELKSIFSFTYYSELDNGFIENEYDHVLFGIFDAGPNINKEEVESFHFISIEDLIKDINTHPEFYKEWLKICLPGVKKHYSQFGEGEG